MGGGARALVRQPKTAGFFCENRPNQAALKVLKKTSYCFLVKVFEHAVKHVFFYFKKQVHVNLEAQ